METTLKLGRKRTNDILRNMSDGNFNEIVRPFVFVDLASAIVNAYEEACNDDGCLEVKLRKHMQVLFELRASEMKWDDDILDRYKKVARKALSELV